MDDRQAIARSIANLWAFHALFIGRLMVALREEGAISDEALEKLLQLLDGDVDCLDGIDDQAFGTALLVSAREILAARGYGKRKSGRGSR